MPHSTVTLTSDDIDDLIYFSRAGNLDSLKEAIENLSKKHTCSPYSVLGAAIDIDEEGLGSGSCLLHYPAANGNLEIVTYLLSLIESAFASFTDSAATLTESTKFINHQNVSGNTPLHWAGMNGHLQVVQVLVKAGADPEMVNGAGRDAVVESEWSSKDGANDCAVWMLKECGALEKGVGEAVAEAESSERIDDENHTNDDQKDGDAQ